MNLKKTVLSSPALVSGSDEFRKPPNPLIVPASAISPPTDL